MNNPLIPELLEILHLHPDGVSEYTVIQVLEEHPRFSMLEEKSSLSLFQKHFIVMNGLYHLQQRLWQEEQVFLEISPLKIVLSKVNEGQSRGDALLADGANLSGYYRDWSNIEEMDEADVEALLDSFWSRYVTEDLRGPALVTLDLEVGADRKAVTQRYRQLAAANHPDRGGDAERFIEIRQAYEVLIA